MPRAWIAIGGIALARIAYLIWLSPYELVADEAQYWDWSRRLAWSYYSKGPGIAWLLALSTSLFGVREWTVRLPAAVAFAVTAAAVAQLAVDFSSHRSSAARAALIAALLVSLLPVYQLTAILMTTDAPFIACWAIAVLCAWRAYVSEREGRPSWRAWIGCGLAIAAGFLFKYTMLLLIPGLLWFARAHRSHWQPGAARRGLAAGVLIGLGIAPVVLWNLQHQNAGLSHLLGYFAVPSGDRPIRAAFSYDPRWTAELVLAEIAIVGPVLYLFYVTFTRARQSDAARFAVWCAVPSLVVFLLFTLRTPVEANWPAAAYVSLLPVAACLIAEQTQGLAAKCWRGIVAYGLAAGVLIHAPLVAASLPFVGRFVPTHRFRGFASHARELAAIQSLDARLRDPLIVAPSHNAAGLLAFYLPGRPVVASAGRFLGDRPSAYDYFADTDLEGPLATHRDALLIGATQRQWESAFVLDQITLVSMDGPQWLATAFRGPRKRCDGC